MSKFCLPTVRLLTVTSGSQAGSSGNTNRGAGARGGPRPRLQQHERRASRPGLRDVRAEILHREVGSLLLDAGVELRDLVELEISGRPADVVRDRRRFRAETVALEAERDHAVVVRPH